MTGDMHGGLGIKKFLVNSFSKGRELTKNDFVIILGDFGVPWANDDYDKDLINWLNYKPWTTLFVDGNHENFNILKEMPAEKMFGGTVGKLSDSIYHLRRGEIYTIEGNTFFTFGGASSIDKADRFEGISWWPEEIPSFAETSHGLDNLVKNNWEVDYILTHTCPQRIFDLLGEEFFYKRENDPTRKFLDYVDENTRFKKWYFGHFHDEKLIEGKYRMMYDEIEELR